MLMSAVNIEKLCEELTDYSFMVSLETIDLVNRMIFNAAVDTGENGDVIMVFGSPTCTRHRAPKGVQLLFDKRAPYILLSGGKEIPETGHSEAENMWMQLRSLGVRNSEIILENESMFTHENVLFSSDILKSFFYGNPIKILAVTSSYHMRRVMLNFEHYRSLFPEGSSWVACASNGSGADDGIWHTTSVGRYRIAKECLALVNYTRQGYLPDVMI